MKTVLTADSSRNAVFKLSLLKVFRRFMTVKPSKQAIIEKSSCANAGICKGLCGYGMPNHCKYYVSAGEHKDYILGGNKNVKK